MATVTTTPTPEQLQALMNGPAGKPPAGVLPNFQHPPNLNAFLSLTLTLVLTFGTLAILMRMYTKLFIIRSVAYEDCTFPQLVPPICILMLLRCCHARMGRAWGRGSIISLTDIIKLFQIAEIVPSAVATRHGGGSHMWDIRLKTFFDLLYVRSPSEQLLNIR